MKKPEALSMLVSLETERMLTAMTTQSEEMDGYVIITGPANHHRDSGKCQTEAPSRYRMKFT